jgi:predicted RNase H-like HicB family nuclease
MRQIKVIVEKHADGYVAYPLGLKGVVVGEGDTYEEALADVKSAIQFPMDAPRAKVIKELIRYLFPPCTVVAVAEATDAHQQVQSRGLAHFFPQ